MSRFDRDRQTVAQYLPTNTQHFRDTDGTDIWVFKKTTELGIVFEIAIYFDKNEGGYCAQVISPKIEDAWRDPHVGHLFNDGVICMGSGPLGMKAVSSIQYSFSKACLWAEGMAIMIQSNLAGQPVQFPFSNNNSDSEAGRALRG